ncbi:glial cell line-derived neurotrophic factor [Rhineura floridana]|uniref:glial cell line-derived neurotrophic factor n=1 Tax=Rhineura floridana TaxID=261503 RepID=UPI002AC836BC|nr:glial cell line-derived neurotrophic factor [Rhineura floridana]XP_061472619.1 glial cell line-derived neurotrophic factor [Rhineura floridana]XP_061472629.1 glial cell line-derived neurotrophic factor [Rhineura floridana]
MKLWDVVAVCMVLLNTISTFPLPAGKTPLERDRSVLEGIEEDHTSSRLPTPYAGQMDSKISEDYPNRLGDVMDYIQATMRRLKRSPDKPVPYFSKRERNRQNAAKNTNNSSNRKRQRGQRGRNRDCVLTEIHLNVTDLGLGYTTKEELIFRYCSGSCESAVSVYDQILNNLTQNRKLVSDKIRPQPCCRPIAYDDDVSFLDDDLSTYHILRKHSAKKCGCI